jgi:hypothetical protein
MDIPYDPDFIYDPQSDSEEDVFDEDWNEVDFDIELDDDSEPIGACELGVFEMSVAAGLGYHMAQDEIDEDAVAKKLLRRIHTDKKQIKVPLSTRHNNDEEKGKPFERWYLDVLRGRKKITDPLDYTEKELFLIAQAELEDEIE